MNDNKFKKVSGLPDPGTELASVAREQEIRKRLAAGDPIQTEFTRSEEVDAPAGEEELEHVKVSVPIVVKPVPPRQQTLNPLEAISEMIRLQDQNTLVEVQGQFGKISFRAVNVSTNDYGLAFIIHKDHMSYEPNINTELRLKIGEEVHDVVYAGGFFTFRHIPFNFLSFIKISK